MSTLAILLFLGVQEWVIIVLAIVLLFGGRKIPELMRGIGQGIREFNNAKNDVKKHIEDGMKDETKNNSDKS
ncbi:MAG: twin-arginine translocase TatA/TatE family subunit [Flavobacteriales bacterium]|nr:twin-arginine translocase TatA/TatE family subunit [Flavobacteriales bacterium]